ncbi:MAG: DUF4307 domain-containing protein [Actinobacteria bacterium]|nr:DUF4307 domain-containing protein [Actinomycetota bacterium]
MSQQIGGNEEFLAQRYGKKGSNTWRFIAALLLLTAIPWLIWSAWHHSNPEIRVTLISFQNEQDSSIEITYLIQRRDPSLALNCTLVARDFDKNVVGEIAVAIPGSSQSSLTRNDQIPTRLRAVNASVLNCDAIDSKGK